MRPIGAQLLTQRRRMAGANWIIAGDGSWLEIDRGQGQMADGEPLQPGMYDKRLTPSRDGLQQDMDCDISKKHFRPGGMTPLETPRCRIAPPPASIPHVALHIALQSPFRRFFSLCRSIRNTHSIFPIF